MEKLIRHTVIKRNENDEYVFLLSDESIDRHGTVILNSAWGLEDGNDETVVLWMHKSGSGDPDNVLGRGEVWSENKEINLKVHWEEENDFAQKIKGKVDFGSIKSVSVGFIPKRGHWGNERNGENEDVYYFDEVELIEASIVDIPSNKNANKRAYSEYLKNKKVNTKEKEKAPKNKRSLSYYSARARFLKLKS